MPRRKVRAHLSNYTRRWLPSITAKPTPINYGNEAQRRALFHRRLRSVDAKYWMRSRKQVSVARSVRLSGDFGEAGGGGEKKEKREPRNAMTLLRLGDVDGDGIWRSAHDGFAVGIRGLRAQQHSYLREGISRLRRVLRGARGLVLRQFATHLEYRYIRTMRGGGMGRETRLNEHTGYHARFPRIRSKSPVKFGSGATRRFWEQPFLYNNICSNSPRLRSAQIVSFSPR